MSIHQKRLAKELAEALLMSTHSICFRGVIRKLDSPLELCLYVYGSMAPAVCVRHYGPVEVSNVAIN